MNEINEPFEKTLVENESSDRTKSSNPSTLREKDGNWFIRIED